MAKLKSVTATINKQAIEVYNSVVNLSKQKTATIQIEYKKEIKPGDIISLCVGGHNEVFSGTIKNISTSFAQGVSPISTIDAEDYSNSK